MWWIGLLIAFIYVNVLILVMALGKVAKYEPVYLEIDEEEK